VKVTLGPAKGVAIVEWKSSPAGDVIADSVVALLMHAQSSAASIRLTSKPCRHPRDLSDGEERTQSRQRTEEDNSKERLRFIYATLNDQFDNVEATYEGNRGTYEITTDCGLESTSDPEGGAALVCSVTVQLDDASAQAAEITVECVDEKLAKNVRECLQNVAAATVPISSSA